MWDGTGVEQEGLDCHTFTESECMSAMNGKSKARCMWKGKLHSKTSKLKSNVESEAAVNGWSFSDVMNMEFSTFDVLLGCALCATFAFAVYQVYKWCAYRAKMKGYEYTPIAEHL